MNPILLAIGIAILWTVTGFLFFPKNTALTIFGSLPWAFAIGGFLWGYGQFLFNTAGGRLSTHALCVVAIMVLIAGLLKCVYERRSWTHSWYRQAVSGIEVVSTFILLFVFGIALMEVLTFPIHNVDAVTCFGLKAKALYLFRTYRIPFFYERGIVHVQPDYPLLVPYLESFYYRMGRSVDDIHVRLIFLFYGVCLVSLVYQSLRLRLERNISLLLTAIFASVPLFLIDRDTQFVSGAADVILMVYETIAVVSAARGMVSGFRIWRWWVIFGSLGCLFCKPQGLVITVILWISLLYFLPRADRRAWTVGIFWLAIFSCPWLLIQHHLPREIIFPPLTLPTGWPFKIVHKLPILLAALIKEPFRFSQWGFYWPCLALLLFWKSSPCYTPARLLCIIVLLQFLCYWAVYLIYPQPIQWWIDSSLTRWLAHGSALLLVSTGWSISQSLKETPY